MTTDPSPHKTTSGTTNGGHKQVWVQPERPYDQERRSATTDQQKELYLRLVIVAILLVSAFALVPFVEPRAVDPLNRWLIVEPLTGLLLFWPLSRVLIRATDSLTWGALLALIPAITLISLRFFASQRDPVTGSQPNITHGATIFLVVCSVTAYLLFRTPPRT